MMNGGGRCRFPFTASQWQELEHQALVFKYMVSGMPIPPDLLYTIRRSLDSSISSKFLLPQPQSTIGWNSFQMGFGRKIDPEPGRCRRTDGKKWRCSKEAYPDSKYCERHMHRGRNRSRKPVEILSPPPTNPTATTNAAAAATPTPQPPPNAIPITNTTSIKSPSSLLHHHPYLTSVAPSSHYHPSSRPPPPPPQESTTNFFLESNSAHHPHSPGKGSFRNGSLSGGCSSMSDAPAASWKLSPLTMGSSTSSSLYQMDQISRHMKNGHHYYTTCGDSIPPSSNLEMDSGGNDHQSQKVMHHFLDEWQPPKDKDSCWANPEDKMPSHRTQLSISIPNSVHDFFMTQKW